MTYWLKLAKKLYFKKPGKEEKRLRKFVIKKEKKYLIKIPSIYSSSIINNRGVDLSLKGKFQMAENLFKESIIEYPHDPAAYNNLGIIYELFKNRKEAFKMYSKACLIDPQNLYFRKNFLTFVDSTKK